VYSELFYEPDQDFRESVPAGLTFKEPLVPVTTRCDAKQHVDEFGANEMKHNGVAIAWP
jgi:hypothetical protein